MRQKTNLCCHAYSSSTGILTGFPFPLNQFMIAVRTNLPLAELHCQGTLALSAAEILTLLCSYFYQDSHSYTVHLSSQKNFIPYRTPAYHSPFGGLRYRLLT